MPKPATISNVIPTEYEMIDLTELPVSNCELAVWISSASVSYNLAYSLATTGAVFMSFILI